MSYEKDNARVRELTEFDFRLSRLLDVIDDLYDPVFGTVPMYVLSELKTELKKYGLHVCVETE